MASAAVLLLEECRDAQRRTEVRQRLHDRFHRWLERVEDHVKAPTPPLEAWTAAVLAQPRPTNGTGSAKRSQPRTPAMTAELTDRVWTLREVLLFRVPPWPQLQELQVATEHDDRETERAKCARRQAKRAQSGPGPPM
jgi:hypothetical protein